MERELFVRYARMEDVAVLGHIMAASIRSAFADFIPKNTIDACAVEENCAELFRGILEERKMGVLLGGIDGEPLGLLVFREQPDGWTEIEAIHSMPESWGSGLGGRLLEFALEETNAKKGVGLWAFEENRRARRFYEKQGLCWTGERRTSQFGGAPEIRYERKWD